MLPDTFYVGPADRRLLLGAISAHGYLPHPAPLGRLAALATEATYGRGAVVNTAAPIDGVLIVVDGSLRQVRDGWPDEIAHGGETLGLIATLARDPAPVTVTATHAALVLHVSHRSLDQTLAGSFPLVHGYLQYLARRYLAERPGDRVTPARRKQELPTRGESLDLAERIVALGASDDLGTNALNALAELARHVVEKRPRREEVLWSPGMPAEDVLFLVQGSLHGGRASDASVHGPGALIGFEETLSGGRREATLMAGEDSIVLTAQRDVFLDILEDHPRLARLVLARLAGSLMTPTHSARVSRIAQGGTHGGDGHLRGTG